MPRPGFAPGRSLRDLSGWPSALLDRIEQGMDKLRPSEQRVARYVLRHPNQVINLSFPEIAAETGGASPPLRAFALPAAL